MKGIYLTASILIVCLRLAAQAPASNAKSATPAHQPPPALDFRDVSGVVLDENDDAVIGAKVRLYSPLDSSYTVTNTNGVFVFKQVRRASFYITVTGQGIDTTTRLYRNNDLSKQIVLDPIELKPKSIVLKEIVINGKPTIIYKGTDTVEYKASDYKVREGDALEELLKKMEGFDVGRDGSLFYQGQKIEKARLNGKDFLGGAVATVIQTLPAEIIEKAQVIDDYGERAARTGIKDTDPTKLLNVTTKADRSIGTIFSPNVAAGNDDRYNVQLSLTRLNANRQIGFAGRLSNTQTGIATGTNGGGGSGTTRSANPSISYSDQWTKLRLTSSYNYTYNNNNSINSSFGETYTSGESATVKNTSFFNAETSVNTINKGHRANGRIDYTFDKKNNILIQPSFNYTSGSNTNTAIDDRINNYTTGFEHQIKNGINRDKNNSTSSGLTALYQHYFDNSRRNLTVELGVNNSDTKANGSKFTTYSFFADGTQNNRLRADSVANLQTRRTNMSTTLNTNLTYLEPLSASSKIEFSGRLDYSVSDNVTKQDTVQANGQIKELTRLSNIYNYSFTEARLQLNYSYNGEKINISVGGTFLPTSLSGTRVNNNNNQTVSSSINNLRVIPVLRFTYIWSTTERASLSYSGSNTLPTFQQIQPFTDRSDPIYITTGNPNLKPAFTNSVRASYVNYLANSKTIINLSVSASQIMNQIVPNTILTPRLITAPPNPVKYSTVNETTYLNLDGSYSVTGNYTLGKQIARGYNLSLDGTISYAYNMAMNNNAQYSNTVWRINQRFGPKINPTDDIEINPYVYYDIQRSFASLAGANSNQLQTLSLAIDGRFFIADAWRVNYSASKNYVKGVGQLSRNPLVINAGVERQLTKKNNLYLTFNVYDIFKQNNFIQQTVTPNGITNTLSNALSRYFMVGLRANFQKWGGKPERNGEVLKRKGDGSFIY